MLTNNTGKTLNNIMRRDLLWLAIILLVAAGLRLGLPGTNHFNYDQAEVTLLAQQVANADALPLIGQQSSGGLPNSPMAHLLLALPFAIFREPYPVTLFIGIWNVLGVGIFWLILHRYIDPKVAIIAALLFAVNPNAVYWSRSIWIQDIHTPIILMGLWLTLRGFIEDVKWAQVAFFPVWLIGVQVHYAAWFLLPIMLWLLWINRRNIHWRPVFVSGFLAVLVMLPMAIGFIDLLANDPTALSDAGNDAPLRLRSKVFYRLLPVFTGLNIETVDKTLNVAALLNAPLQMGVGLLLLTATILGFVGTWVRSHWRNIAVLLILWVILPVLVFWPNWTGVYAHYYVPVLPGFCLAGGLGFAWALEVLEARWRRAGTVLMSGLLVIIILFNGVTFLSARYRLRQNPTVSRSNAFAEVLPVRDALRAVDDVLILGGQSSYSGWQVWGALMYHTADVREVVVNGGGVAIFPEGSFAVLTAPGAMDYPVTGLYDTGETMVFPAGAPLDEAYRIDMFDTAPHWTGPSLIALDDLPAFVNGVQLDGYAIDEGSVYTSWAILDASSPPEDKTRYFVHFLDENGERIGQQDVDFLTHRAWQEGDTVILWFDGAVPEGAATLRFGMYTQNRMTNEISGIDAIDANGASMPWIDVPVTP